MSAWLPITSAPKDGTPALIYWPRYAYSFEEEPAPRIAIGWWAENYRIKAMHERNTYLDWSASYFHDCDEEDDYGLAVPEHAPTHWMPLPEPPEQRA